MNGRLERGMRVAGVLILAASLQFVACLFGPVAALIVALLLGAAGTWLWLHFELLHHPVWLPPLALTGSVFFAILTVELAVRPDFASWFAPLLTLTAASVTLGVMHRRRSQCNLCGRVLGTRGVVFHCPRCSMAVCDETCWSFEHRRCNLCLEQRVPILSIQDSWWSRVAGPRSLHGRCQLCLGAAEGLDLRACPHCRRPQCRSCWDFNNGECARCARSLPDLPPALTMAVAEVSEPPQAYTR